MATANLVPTLESSTLSSNSANEWAENTKNLLDAHKPSTPSEKEPQIPGAFPEESTAERNVDVELPPQEDVERAITTSAAQTENEHLRAPSISFVSLMLIYFRDSAINSCDFEVLKPPRPPFAANDTQSSNLSNLSTKAQAGSLPPLTDSDAGSVSTIGDISTTVHTGRSASPHPVAPLSRPLSPPSVSEAAVPARRQTPPVLSKFIEGLTTPPPHTDSPVPFLPPTSASPVPHRPHEHREHAPGESSGQSEGVPAPANSLATDMSVDGGAVAPGGVGLTAGAPDVVAPPAPHGVLLPVNEPSSHPKPDSEAARTSTDSAPPDVNTDSGTDTDGAHTDGAGRRKRMMKRLKEKIHIGH
ncbi:hypothetical protein C8R45DRAFT_1193880 [Mycena sanguinolenta]|nr:hypothetical protein C8R45DRAFT_1193880 [Mycena sanguinolenta]